MAQPEQTYVVRDSATPCLNIRPDHDSSVDPLDCVPPGTRLTGVSSVPYWREVVLEDGRRGWVAKKFLEAIPEPPPAPPDAPLPADAFLEVHFVDVGQGDAIWIHTHDDTIDGNGRFEGFNIVIDGGPSSADQNNRLFQYIRDHGHHGAVIDALIVTHPHTDHFRGAETITRHFAVRDYYDPGFPSTLSSYAGFLDAVRGTGGEPPRAERIHLGLDTFGTLDWGSELTAEFLYAWPGDATGLGSGNTVVNNSSIVLRVEYGSHSFLFMGDAEGKDRDDPPDPSRYVERILLDTADPAKLRASVLKVGHHGSETSSTADFIAAVDPDIVVVQSGRQSFGGRFIPDDSTLRRYCCHNSGIRIYRTDQNDKADGLTGSNDDDGDDIVIRTNGTTLEVTALEGGEPFEVTSCQPACPP